MKKSIIFKKIIKIYLPLEDFCLMSHSGTGQAEDLFHNMDKTSSGKIKGKGQRFSLHMMAICCVKLRN